MGFLDWLRGKDEKQVFAERMIRALKKTGESRKITYVKESFELHIGDSGNRFFLGNAWSEYQAAPRGEREMVFQGFALSLADPGVPDTWARAESHVLPRVRERCYYEFLKLRVRIEGDDPTKLQFLARPLTEHLSEGLVYDGAHTIRELDEKQLESWGVRLADADLRGLENLRRMSEGGFASPRPGLHVSLREDTHDATRLLLEDEVRSLRVKGAPVAFVPHRNALFITGSEDEENLLGVAKLLEQNLEMPRLMTLVPVRLGEDGWETWSPTIPALQRLDAISRGREYMEQKELLDALHEKEGTDDFTASVMLFEKKGQARSLATWTEGVPTLLPRTQWVGFVKQGASEKPEACGTARFERVLEVAPELMKPVADLYPFRWKVEGFPSKKQLEQVVEEID